MLELILPRLKMVCRLCYSSIEQCIDIFSDEKIAKYIKKFLDLDITPHDPVSKLICNTCWQELKSFQNFYTRIKEAQQRTQLTLKKEPAEKEFEPTLEYDNAELNTDQDDNDDSNEPSEITVQNEELTEQNVPHNDDHQNTTEVPQPNYILKKVRHYRRMTKSTRSFKTEAERKHFVDLMEKEDVIWNRTHALHSSPRALTEAWKRIAGAMLPPKTVHECKTMWKSLRDALRYERRKAASGFDQGNDLRNLLYFISSASHQNPQKKATNTHCSKATKRKFTIQNRSIQYKIQNYHTFENANPIWSEVSQSDNMSAYSEAPAKHLSNNVSDKGKMQGTVGVLSTDSATCNNNMQSAHQPSSSSVEYNSASNVFHADVKKEFKDEVTDLVDSISKALNRLVTIATNQVQIKSQTHEFKYDYIWKLIECLYAQMEDTTINDINQRIINMVYEGCKVNVY